MKAPLREPAPPAATPPERLELPPTVAPKLLEALNAWQQRLNAAGVATRAVAFHSADPAWSIGFAADQKETALNASWIALQARITPQNPVALGRVEAGVGADHMLIATILQLPGGQHGIVGACLSPPHNEKIIQLLLLSLGWLQLALSAQVLAQNHHAVRLLELIGHVGSQAGARAAAQEWVNRSAAWARGESQAVSGLGLTLFEMRRDVPRWWVASDTAGSEKASAAVQESTELATRASVEMREVCQVGAWALPVLAGGEPVAVLVARCEGAAWPAEVLAVLRASVGLAEPLLRHWRQADRPLGRHAWESSQSAWRKLSRPGHLTWKFGAAALGGVLGVLLLWPVPDRVTAQVVIEGRVRQVVTAPFEGFIAQALVRPGSAVLRGQVLARLDDRDLQLEQGKFRSEREQALGKQRQAMAERDAPALVLASAEVMQAEAQLALVVAKLARAELRAPLDGIVVSGDWVQQIGGPVETGKEMFEIAATDGYRVVLHVPDRFITAVHAGQPGALRLTGQPQQSHAFLVSTVTATASVQDGMNGFRVEAAWQGPAPLLSPGMQGVGKITVGSANLITVWTRSSIDWLRLKLWGWWW